LDLLDLFETITGDAVFDSHCVTVQCDRQMYTVNHKNAPLFSTITFAFFERFLYKWKKE